MGSFSAVILAGGQGKRMRSSLPKPLHEVCGVPMLAYVFELARAVSPRQILAVVGRSAEVFEARFKEADISWVVQGEPVGTADAVKCAVGILDEGVSGVLVLQADMPLVRKRTVKELVRRHEEAGAAATMGVCEHPEPGEMGRVIRDRRGEVMAIREYADASAEEREIDEVNVGCYCFEAGALGEALGEVEADNVQGELYLTDVISRFYGWGKRVVWMKVDDPTEAFGVSSREDVERACALMKGRIVSGEQVECDEGGGG